MKYLLQFLVFNIILLSSNIYAASGDSVMNAPSTTATPSMSYNAATASSGNIYSYTYTTQYQTSICPSGLTVNGSSIYNSAQRQITYSYLGTQLVGSNTGAWTDIDTDCTGTQTQTIACPAGYVGVITQQRKIGTASNGNGTLQYGDWVTTGNSCTLPYPAAGTVLYAGGYGVTFKGAADVWVQAIATGDGRFYLLMTRPRLRNCTFAWDSYNSNNMAYLVDNSGVGLSPKNGGNAGNC